jgi:hypothetical protein
LPLPLSYAFFSHSKQPQNISTQQIRKVIMAPAQSAERDVDSEFALHKQAIKLARNRKLAQTWLLTLMQSR